MTTVYCYRFPDRDTWLAAADAEGLIAGGQLLAYTYSHAIDVIGTITEGGTYDEDGNELTPPTVLPGWHVNSSIAPEAWDEYLVVVNSAFRKFLGGPTQVPGDDVLEEIAALP